MTLVELSRRVATLEATLEQIREQIAHGARQRTWWREDAGRFEEDPVFDEIVELGRAFRESQRPGARKKRSVKNDHS
jgi:hypothetical protein